MEAAVRLKVGSGKLEVRKRSAIFLPLPTSSIPLLALAYLTIFVGCETAPPPAVAPPIAKVTKPEPAAPPRVLDRTFDDIKFDIEPDAPFDRSMLTDKVRELDGKPIRIRGYILPTSQASGIKRFVLVRDNQECCFGPGAALFDCILVTMQGGKSAEFSVRPVAVEGKFKVEEFYGPDDKPLAIYRLDGEAVK
jgi:hypothetical protein